MNDEAFRLGLTLTVVLVGLPTDYSDSVGPLQQGLIQAKLVLVDLNLAHCLGLDCCWIEQL